VIEVTGCGTDFSNVAVNTNTAGDPSCTLPSAPGATSAVFGFAVGHLSNAFTQTAGFTELYDSIPTGASNHRVEFAYDLSSPAQTLGWTSTETNSVGVAFEVKEPASGAITATASPTLSAFVSAAAAKALVEGTGAGTLNPFTAASVAKVRGKATASVTPAAFVSTSAAAVRVKAAASATPNAFASQAAADILVEGAGAGILHCRRSYRPPRRRRLSKELAAGRSIRSPPARRRRCGYLDRRARALRASFRRRTRESGSAPQPYWNGARLPPKGGCSRFRRVCHR
jgi:hypothetical protein